MTDWLSPTDLAPLQPLLIPLERAEQIPFLLSVPIMDQPVEKRRVSPGGERKTWHRSHVDLRPEPAMLGPATPHRLAELIAISLGPR